MGDRPDAWFAPAVIEGLALELCSALLSRRGLDRNGLLRLLLALSCPPRCQPLGHTQKDARTVKSIVQRLSPLKGLGLLAGCGFMRSADHLRKAV
jgi:hypothetical protein